ncbi:MAG TPA: TPM domain-containing protein, partial [Myxococcaceae bacterium]|nr:TPM domain-containing protein [Myxococcaceae bacterium]
MDEAGLLNARDSARLEALSRAVREGSGGAGVQLQFLLIPALEGEAMEAFSIRVAEAWKLGTRGQDNGLLFVVARDDRKMRIEVGGGIEGGLTDAQSGRIIRNTLAPAFRAGRYGDGLYAGAQEALSALGALPQDLRAAPRRAAPRGTGGGSLLFFGLFGLWLLLSLL